MVVLAFLLLCAALWATYTVRFYDTLGSTASPTASR
jgi:hypothetical protein